MPSSDSMTGHVNGMNRGPLAKTPHNLPSPVIGVPWDTVPPACKEEMVPGVAGSRCTRDRRSAVPSQSPRAAIARPVARYRRAPLLMVPPEIKDGSEDVDSVITLLPPPRSASTEPRAMVRVVPSSQSYSMSRKRRRHRYQFFRHTSVPATWICPSVSAI